MSIELLLQSLRLWNRAMDNLTRLNPPPSKSSPPPTTQKLEEDNPFDMSSLKQALPSVPPSQPQPLPDPVPSQPALLPNRQHNLSDPLSLRIAEGLFTVLFDLAQSYLIRGSVKESEYFITQALDLGKALNAPAMVSKAMAKFGEVMTREGKVDEGYEMLVKAGEVLSGVNSRESGESGEGAGMIEEVEVGRVMAECRERMGEVRDAEVLVARSGELWREIDRAFEKWEGGVAG